MSIKTIILILTTTMMINGCKGQTQAPVVRPATQANRFYTGDARELSEEVDSFLALHRNDAKYSNVAALIVPHAGYYFSGNVAASAYMAIDAKKQYKRIFLLGPSHHEWLDGASVNTEVLFTYRETVQENRRRLYPMSSCRNLDILIMPVPRRSRW